MEQTHKKRSPRATANSPPGLLDMGEIYFINLKLYLSLKKQNSL